MKSERERANIRIYFLYNLGKVFTDVRELNRKKLIKLSIQLCNANKGEVNDICNSQLQINRN